MPHLSEISVQFVKGVGPAKAKLFSNLGVESVEDLLYFFPRRYDDRRDIASIATCKVGEWQTITGEVKTYKARKSWHTKKHLTEVVFDDGSGRMTGVWFNQPYLQNYFKDGAKAVLHGKVDIYKDRLQMISPEYEIITAEDDENLSINAIVPIYPLTKGITQRYLRKVINSILKKFKKQLQDDLPVDLRNRLRLANIKRSIESIHFPQELDIQEEAIKRISFEEFYFFQIALMLRRQSIIQKKGIAHKISDAQALSFIDGFDFELTKSQKKVIREIREDLESEKPMLRLLQGDVGCGKTLVALFGCMASKENNKQSAIMAPTEILAKQHYENICTYVKAGVLKEIKPALLISSLKKKEKDELYAKIKKGKIDLVVGTHALINDEVTFKDLSYCVVDEQHKFGVNQRSLLAEKGSNPDILIMTATPIPRTLCITLYGDLDLSIIDEMPKGRGKIVTQHYAHAKAHDAYAIIKEKVKEGRQAYVVYPIIEESETQDLKAAKDMVKKFKKDILKNFKVSLLHGQMKQDETTKIMSDFKDQKIDVLVATTVLEVGIDVPNATVMVIEHADRFGLAQLHQLRGRIGRGKHDSQCLLIADPITEEGQLRLKAILESTDGFKIAQRDLEIRGARKILWPSSTWS